MFISSFFKLFILHSPFSTPLSLESRTSNLEPSIAIFIYVSTVNRLLFYRIVPLFIRLFWFLESFFFGSFDFLKSEVWSRVEEWGWFDLILGIWNFRLKSWVWSLKVEVWTWTVPEFFSSSFLRQSFLVLQKKGGRSGRETQKFSAPQLTAHSLFFRFHFRPSLCNSSAQWSDRIGT